MKVFWNPDSQLHDPHFFLQRGHIRAHLEVADRAEALLGACRSMGLPIHDAAPADWASLTLIHDPDYLTFLKEGHAAWRAVADAAPEMVPNIHPSPEMRALHNAPPSSMIGKLGWYTTDLACPIAEGTWQAALAAAGTALAAADEAAHGNAAYALIRPPGHHAYRARAGGHCYLNNAALAAQALRRHGADRVAILDIDSHHGNGTQDIFYTRDDVAAIMRCKPDALVVSLGFDASKDEPLAALSVTEEGFARAGAMIGATGLPNAIIQEGGYNIDVMGGLLSRFLDGFNSP